MNERFIADKLLEFPKGWSAKVRPIIPYANISLSKTALHEAKHLVLLHANGTGAKSGTIEPRPGYLGMVEPHGFDAVAALGPDADGDTGTEHDKRVAAWGGADIDSSRKVARTMLNRLREEVRLVAGLLEVERTVSGGRLSEVINKYQQDPDEEVEVVDPIGNISTTKTLRSKRHEILFGVNEKNKNLENKVIKKVRNNFRPLTNKIKILTKIAA